MVSQPFGWDILKKSVSVFSGVPRISQTILQFPIWAMAGYSLGIGWGKGTLLNLSFQSSITSSTLHLVFPWSIGNALENIPPVFCLRGWLLDCAEEGPLTPVIDFEPTPSLWPMSHLKLWQLLTFQSSESLGNCEGQSAYLLICILFYTLQFVA